MGAMVAIREKESIPNDIFQQVLMMSLLLNLSLQH